MNKREPQDSDVAVPNPPSDGISSISLNGNATTPSNLLIATSWDNSVSCYELKYNGAGGINNIIPQSQIKHDAPVLCSDISSDNFTVFTGGADNVLKMWNVTQGANGAQNIGSHDQPIKVVRHIAEKNLVVTGSWDKTIKVWDMRQPTPTATIPLTDRVYAMDAKGSAMVVGTADLQMHVFDLTSGNKIAQYASPLQYQIRTISLFSDMKGYAVGSIEGRTAIEYFDEMHKKNEGVKSTGVKPKNFAFKCHREGSNVYSVNAIDFHPKNTFVTCGSDGVLCTWDKDSRQRLGLFERYKSKCPISAVKFSKMGNLMVYSVSYDWSRGAEHNDPKLGNNIYIHNLDAAEINPKPKK